MVESGQLNRVWSAAVSIFHEMRERRIIPAIGVYIGASWVVVEILDRLVERYLLSPYITDIAFWGLYSMLPAVFLMSWTHGRPGKDKTTRVEKVGVPINIIATLGLLITVFGGKDMGAAANLVTVANELGEQEQHYVPRDSFRRRTAVFFWENQSGDPELDWLQYGITDLLVQDLQQNPFLLVTSPWNNLANGFHARMKQAGFEDGLNLPLSLMREIAVSANRPYFLEGDLRRNGEQLEIAVRVWESETLTRLGEVREQGWDTLTLVDRLSEGVRDVLDVPSGKGRLADDLPLAETYGESEAAHKEYIAAMNVLLFENDWEASNAHYDRALEIDPDFVLAWFMKGVNQFEQGDIPGAQQSLAAAQKLDYRLPARDQVLLKGFTYRISGEQEKLEKFLRLQVRLQGDASSQRSLARFLMITGRLEEAKQAFKLAMEKDSSDLGGYHHLALLERATGNLDAAIDYARLYNEKKQEDTNGLILLGHLMIDAGDMESARDFYEQAQLLEDPPLAPTLSLALLAVRQGEWTSARSLLDEARSMAPTSIQMARVLQVEIMLEYRLGRIRKAIDLTSQQLEYTRQSIRPVQQVIAYSVPVVQYSLMLDDIDLAEETLQAAKPMLQAPMDQFLSFSEANILARKGEFEAAYAVLEKGRAAIELFKADYLAFQIPLTAGVIAAEQEEWTTAARQFEEAIHKAERSILGSELHMRMSLMYGACAEMHVRAGELDLAQEVLDVAFRRDSSAPGLWFARSLLQQARGNDQMALASVNYALAIWNEANPDYIDYQAAAALRDDLMAIPATN
jgi:tetratricopeptide (TPR) repeat protein